MFSREMNGNCCCQTLPYPSRDLVPNQWRSTMIDSESLTNGDQWRWQNPLLSPLFSDLHRWRINGHRWSTANDKSTMINNEWQIYDDQWRMVLLPCISPTMLHRMKPTKLTGPSWFSLDRIADNGSDRLPDLYNRLGSVRLPNGWNRSVADRWTPLSLPCRSSLLHICFTVDALLLLGSKPKPTLVGPNRQTEFDWVRFGFSFKNRPNRKCSLVAQVDPKRGNPTHLHPYICHLKGWYSV